MCHYQPDVCVCTVCSRPHQADQPLHNIGEQLSYSCEKSYLHVQTYGDLATFHIHVHVLMEFPIAKFSRGRYVPTMLWYEKQ